MPHHHPAARRLVPEGHIPLLDITGSTAEAGRALGYAWREALQNSAHRSSQTLKPWWTAQPYRKLVEKYAPYLPTLYENMAAAAGVPLWAVSADVSLQGLQQAADGCTSFAIAPQATLDGVPISGQTKDTPVERVYQYQVLRLKLSDAPSHLTLTYAGWLFGHGFIQGGCAIFRNSLYTPLPARGLDYSLFGLIALHCPNVEEVIRIAADHGVMTSAHIVVADEHGDIAGLELTTRGPHILRPNNGLYVHANCVLGSDDDVKLEEPRHHFTRENSLCRTSRLYELLTPNIGMLTAQQAMYAMADGVEQTHGITRNIHEDAMTSAAVVVEPTKGLLHATRGNPAHNWPVTYRL